MTLRVAVKTWTKLRTTSIIKRLALPEKLQSKEKFHESIALHSQALRQVPYRSAQRYCLHHLRKS